MALGDGSLIIGGRGSRPGGRTGAGPSAGKVEFDTKGVREFTTEIGKAEKGVKSFVDQFERLEKALSRMDSAKLKLLGQVGGKPGAGGGNGGEWSIPQVGPASSYPKHAGSTNNTAGDSIGDGTPDASHNTSRFGGMAGRGGGIAGAYFGAELIQMAGNRLSANMDATRQMYAGFDYANMAGSMRSGRSYNSYSGAKGWADMVGATSNEDAYAARTRVNMHWGAGSMGAQTRFLRQGAAMNLLNPAFGGQAAVMQDYESTFLTPQAQWSMMQQGLTPAITGGKPRAMNDVLGDIILRASGNGNFGQLTRKEAEATFGYGGQGRLNLQQIVPGMSEEMMDAIGMLASEASGGRGVNRGMNTRRLRNSVIGTQFEKTAEDIESGARQTARGRDTMINTIEVEKELAGLSNALKEYAAPITPALQALSGTLSNVLGAGTLAKGVLGEASGGGGGVVGTALGYVGGRALWRGAASTVAGGARAMLGRAGVAGMALYGGNEMRKAGVFGGLRDRWSNIGKKFRGEMEWDLGGGAKDVWHRMGDLDDTAKDFFGGLNPLGDAEAAPNYRPSVGRISWEPNTHLGDGPLRGPGRTAGLKPDFLSRLKAMFEANPRLSLTSGFRTKAEQTRLWNNRHSNPYPVARPGTSSHESGFAADVGPRDQLAWVKQNAPKFGLNVPLSNDPVHVTPLEGAAALIPPTQQPQGEDVSGGPSGSGGFSAMHKFAEGFASSTSGLISALGKSPRFEHAFGGGGGGGLGGVAASGGVTGSNGAGRSDIIAALRAAGFSGESLRMAYAVGMAESRGNLNAVGDVSLQTAKWGPSVGFFQIRSLNAEKGKGTSRDATRLTDINFAAKAAYEISSGGKNWKPWTMFTNQGYKQFYDAGMGDAEAAGSGGHGGGRVTVQGGSNIRIDNVSLTVQATGVSEAEASRLARMVLAKIEDQARMKSIGAH